MDCQGRRNRGSSAHGLKQPFDKAMQAIKTTVLLSMLALVGCGRSGISSEITRQAEIGDGRLDLSSVGGPNWNRLCFFGPYTTNADAKRALGFAWDVEAKTAIESSDGINVLALVTDNEIVAYTEHSRRQDFARLSGRCFPRSLAIFIVREGSYVSPIHDQ
jgi:hypothetical protein